MFVEREVHPCTPYDGLPDQHTVSTATRSPSSMQFTGSPFQGKVLDSSATRERLQERIEELSQDASREELARMSAIVADEERDHDSIRDALSTRLMDVFRLNRSRGCFGLLYELNGGNIVAQVASRLRRYASKSDPLDVLQEVFFNVYRYPHRFDASREDAFRVWSAMIVRNTVLKHLRSHSRGGRMEVPFEDLSDQPTTLPSSNPLQGVLDSESREECARVYMTYLQLYLQFYSMLSDRERRALHLVEVDGASYRNAAESLGIKLENLKMVIFRARRKIHRSMRRVFDGLPHDCRPAREPRPSIGSSGVPRGTNQVTAGLTREESDS